VNACRHCAAPLEGRRSAAWFCSTACRVRAHRRRRAGLAEDAYASPGGGRRGRVALGAATAQEQAWSLVRLGLRGLRW